MITLNRSPSRNTLALDYPRLANVTVLLVSPLLLASIKSAVNGALQTSGFKSQFCPSYLKSPTFNFAILQVESWTSQGCLKAAGVELPGPKSLKPLSFCPHHIILRLHKSLVQIVNAIISLLAENANSLKSYS